jgi:hypothetical protein
MNDRNSHSARVKLIMRSAPRGDTVIPHSSNIFLIRPAAQDRGRRRLLRHAGACGEVSAQAPRNHASRRIPNSYSFITRFIIRHRAISSRPNINLDPPAHSPIPDCHRPLAQTQPQPFLPHPPPAISLNHSLAHLAQSHTRSAPSSSDDEEELYAAAAEYGIVYMSLTDLPAFATAFGLGYHRRRRRRFPAAG